MKFWTLKGEVPPIIGHYCHAVEFDHGHVKISGQKAWACPSGDLIGENIGEQTHIALSNIERILHAISLEKESITMVSCYLAEGVDYASFNSAYSAWFGDHKPARCVLGGHSLRGGALVEFLAEAFREDRKNDL